MQYLVSVIDDKTSAATATEMAAISVFDDWLKAEGHWVFTDGPFLESKEYLAGAWIIEAADLDVVLKLAADGSKHCNRKVEVRPFLSCSTPPMRSPPPGNRDGHSEHPLNR